MIISLHLPKTAGTSFLRVLEAAYGERLLQDYADRPLHRSALLRNSAAAVSCLRTGLYAGELRKFACIHGHFLPLKYRFLRDGAGAGQFVVWLREPLQRLLSHYAYWRRSYDPALAGPLHRRVVEENWSLERFCLAPQLQNLYSRFLWGFPLERFDFIGITEHYTEDLRRFSQRFLQAEPPAVAAQNVSPQSTGELPGPDAALRQRLEQRHARDIALYRRALALRDAAHHA